MKILTFCQYYYPEPFKIHEICEELVKRGHQVTVITGRPNYPDGKLYEGYDSINKMSEVLNGVDVIRTPIVLRGNNALNLIRNYFSYPKHAKKAINRLKDEYDLVFVYQLSPIFMIKPAIYYKQKYEKKLYVYCLDLWPESLKVLHITEKNLVFKVMKKVCNKIYAQCDHISVTSPSFIKYLNEINEVDKEKISFISQHGEKLFLKVRPYRKQPKLNITFAGNIGKAQDFDTLIKAIKEIPREYYSYFKITIIGSGSYEQTLKHLVIVNNLSDVFDFVGRKNVEDLIPYYEKSSLFLLSLEKNSSIGKTIPSKLQTYMAAGRGIIGSIDGTTAEIIKKAGAGKICSAGDYKELKKIIIEVIESEDDSIKRFAENSRSFFLENFILEKHVEKIIDGMNRLLK